MPLDHLLDFGRCFATLLPLASSSYTAVARLVVGACQHQVAGP